MKPECEKINQFILLTRSARVKHLKFMFYEFINTVNLFPTLSLSLSLSLCKWIN